MSEFYHVSKSFAEEPQFGIIAIGSSPRRGRACPPVKSALSSTQIYWMATTKPSGLFSSGRRSQRLFEERLGASAPNGG